MGSPVEIHVLLCEQLDGHVVHGFHLLLQDYGLEERVHTVVALHEGMLRYEERDAPLTQADCILAHHVIAHDLHVAAVGFQQELAYDMSL